MKLTPKHAKAFSDARKWSGVDVPQSDLIAALKSMAEKNWAAPEKFVKQTAERLTYGLLKELGLPIIVRQTEGS